MTERRISLIRHGRSSYVHPGGLMSDQDMHDWRAGYDAAGILDDDRPPPGLRELVASAQVLLASDFPRAIQTAQRLTDSHEIRISPLLREAPADIPTWMPVRLPRALWESIVVVRWGYRILQGTDAPPDDLARATAAAEWIDGLASEHAHIAVVTHGVFRRLLARQLEQLGWARSPGRRSYDHWSVWALNDRTS